MLVESMCTGCGACALSCPVDAIEMDLNVDGFWYPQIDKSKCINCEICNHVCHSLNKIEFIVRQEKPECRAAYVNSKKILEKSSSGGMFWTIAEYVISKNGVVYGAHQDSLFSVMHGRAENLEECLKFRRSKYLESYLGKTYENVKYDLEMGRKVLFSGTGCQVAGLYSYLKQDYCNLVTSDVVCHGVPSLSVFKKYIKETEILFHDKVISINFRDKKLGWSNNLITLYFQSGKRLSMLTWKHPFHGSYLKGLCNRISCETCPYATIPRIGDITLADYWGCGMQMQRDNENRGVSLVLLNSIKGKEIYDSAKSNCIDSIISIEKAKESCYHLCHSPKMSKDRNKFIQKVRQGVFHIVIKKYS